MHDVCREKGTAHGSMGTAKITRVAALPLSPQETTTMQDAYCDSINSITSAHEVYEWKRNPPQKYFVYVSLTMHQGTLGTIHTYPHAIVTTWTGEHLGNATVGLPYNGGGFCASKRRAIWVKGNNGVNYHGTYFESSGDYARITADKHQG
jgi:hypothetical protein